MTITLHLFRNIFVHVYSPAFLPHSQIRHWPASCTESGHIDNDPGSHPSHGSGVPQSTFESWKENESIAGPSFYCPGPW